MQSLGAFAPSLPIDLPPVLLGVLAGPAFSRISRHSGRDAITLEEAHEIAEATKLHLPRLRPAGQGSSTDDETRLVVGIACGLLVIVGYLKHQIQILLVLLLVALGIAIVALFVLTVMSRRKIITKSWGQAFAFVVPLSFSAIGVVTTTFLWDPPAGGPQFHEFVSKYATTGQFANVDGLVYVAYQLMGAISFLLVALGSTLFSLGNLSAVYIARGAWGRPLWRLIYTLTGAFARPRFLFSLLFFGAIAIVLSGGWAYEWLKNLQHHTPTVAS